MTSPRIFGIPAPQAPVVAVIRRGPSAWTHIGAWRTDTDIYEPGAWLRGTIYPQKCDLSADGRLIAYSAMKQPGDWPAGAVYEAVSRLPWLTALAAWGSGTTYTRGIHFTAAADSDVGEPDVGQFEAKHFGLRWNRPDQFCVERRRGWHESPDTPPRETGGPWDENRRVEMTKGQPRGRRLLHVDGRYAAFRAGDPDHGGVSYWMTEDEDIAALDVQWADWDRNGDLLVATSAGVLQRRNLTTGVTTDVTDLSQFRPRPQPAPDWAHSW